MIPPSAWTDPEQMSRQDASNLAKFLEERAQFPDQIQVNQFLVETLAPAPGEKLLEAGSGSGVLCRLVAPAVIPGGHITGLEISPNLAEVAQQYAEDTGLGDHISFEAGNAEAMPFDSESFDGAFAARLLMHSEHPDAITQEMARVVRPGGKVVLMDWDVETTVIDHSDKQLTRRILNWRTDNKDRNNWSGRQLWNRAVSAGLQNLEVFPRVSITFDDNSSLGQTLWRAAKDACDKRAITQGEYDSWVGELQERLVMGTFFASIVYYIVRGNRS